MSPSCEILHLSVKRLRGKSMFWMSLAVSGLAYVFIKLGAYSVWANVLTISLKFALLLIACLVIALIWKKPADDEK